MRQTLYSAAVLIIAGTLFTSGCSTSTSAASVPGAPEVEVATVAQRDVPIYREWIGTLDGMVNAAIKAEVAGYLRTQNYAEGSYVRKGQLLFQIDARPFQAAVDQALGQLAQANGQLAQAHAQFAQAQAQLATAEANQRRTQLDENRYIPLARQQAVTQQDLDDAVQNNLAAKAQVEGAKAQVETANAQIQAATATVEEAQAALDTAKVNLGFTRLISPIDGIAGVAETQVGNLVNPASGPVTTVSTLDPIKVNFTVSEQEYLGMARGGTPIQRLSLDLILADGTTFSHPGRFLFADREVNQNTGALQLTGTVPNPGNILRPGQYAKVRAAVGVRSGALLVPQRAVTELQGNYQVAVVDVANKVTFETVKVGDRVGALWMIDDGLKPGQRVVVEGVMKIRPGMQVTPKISPETPAAQGGH